MAGNEKLFGRDWSLLYEKYFPYFYLTVIEKRTTGFLPGLLKLDIFNPQETCPALVMKSRVSSLLT